MIEEKYHKITLKEYIDTRIKSVEDKIDNLAKFNEQHFELNEMAIKKAEESMTLRLEGMNEFRSQINSERGNYVSKDILNTRIKPLEEAQQFSAGKLWMVMAVFAIIPTILALIALFRGN